MKLGIFIAGLAAFCFIAAGCTDSGNNGEPKKEVSCYSQEALKLDQPLALDLTGDAGNIEVYAWGKKEVKFEITKRLKGVEAKSELEKRLQDFSVSIKQDGGKVNLKSRYRGQKKGSGDRAVDLKIFIPGRIQSISCNLDTGSIRFLDDIYGDLEIRANMANIDINRLEGKINLKSNMGNVNIAGGKLRSGSDITENTGNISVKAAFEETGGYDFETDVGNIDLALPGDSQIGFETTGDLAVNEFTPAFSHSASIKLSSGMGKISIKKYDR